MKSWRETGEDELLEECPCCLQARRGAYACEECWAMHREARSAPGGTHDCRMAFSRVGDRLYADEPVWGVWAVEENRWCWLGKLGATFTKAQAKPMAAGPAFEVRRRIPAPEVAAKPAEDEKVWGVYVRGPCGRAGWCVDESQCPFDERPVTFGEATMRAASLRFARPLAEYEVRRIDDPRCAIPGSSQQYATAVARATPSPIPSGSVLFVRDGQLVAEQLPPPLDSIPLAELARVLFDADETVAAFLDTKSEGDPTRIARNRETAWERDEGGAKTRALATVERIRANRRPT